MVVVSLEACLPVAAKTYHETVGQAQMTSVQGCLNARSIEPRLLLNQHRCSTLLLSQLGPMCSRSVPSIYIRIADMCTIEGNISNITATGTTPHTATTGRSQLWCQAISQALYGQPALLDRHY